MLPKLCKQALVRQEMPTIYAILYGLAYYATQEYDDMTPTIYLDYAATTPLDPVVLEAMQPYLMSVYGNPSSLHRAGRQARQALDEARDSVAAVLRARSSEIIFTASGSEADNLALKGVALARLQRGEPCHIITSAIEHHAVLHAVEYLQAAGCEATILPVDADGLVCPDDVRAALQPATALVSVMYANNEIGTIQPLAELGALCRAHGVLLHTDAVQAAGSLPLDVNALQVDMLTLAAHKFYGPRGVGALYVRRGTPLLPLIHGGTQERQRRAGTENIAGVVGMAAALQLAEERRIDYVHQCTALRDQLIDGVLARIPDTRLNGHRTRRLPNNANLSFAGIDGESMLLLLDQEGICASSGSACTSGSLDPSHVVQALGQAPEQASEAIRFSVGRGIDAAAIDTVLQVLASIAARLRATGSIAGG
jgi:cysteine desulfurase